jgi:hypothetical protein
MEEAMLITGGPDWDSSLSFYTPIDEEFRDEIQFQNMDDIELFRAIRLSGIEHKKEQERQQEKKKLDEITIASTNEAHQHNVSDRVTEIIRVHFNHLAEHAIQPCRSCKHRKVICVHISAHDYVFFAKLSMVCKAWKNMVDSWLKLNSESLELLAFTDTSNDDHRNMKLQKENQHEQVGYRFVGYSVTFTRHHIVGCYAQDRTPQHRHGKCMCYDARWKVLASRLGEKFKIRVEKDSRECRLHDMQQVMIDFIKMQILKNSYFMHDQKHEDVMFKRFQEAMNRVTNKKTFQITFG